MDVLVLPTTGTIYTHDAVAADPVQLNTNLGYYTNFVNLLDLAAVAVPAGFRPNGLPFGVSFIGPAFSDEALLAHRRRVSPDAGEVRSGDLKRQPGCIAVAVVGAHLDRSAAELAADGARRSPVKTCRTAPAIGSMRWTGTKPPKPGLVRDDEFRWSGIEVEVWAVPEDQFGSFVAGCPPPLGIGNADAG